jgi:cob(I)alamin adenosyltransferase
MTEQKRKGRILVCTGTGKGKTTAALGMALRSLGHGRRVLVLEFIKGRRSTGEYLALEKMKENGWPVDIRAMGDGFVYHRESPSSSLEKKKKIAEEAWQEAAREIQSGEWDLVILDEINYAVHIGFVREEDVLRAMKEKPEPMDLVLTGRYASQKIIELADTVTDMQPVKHAYADGIPAMEGIEY